MHVALNTGWHLHEEVLLLKVLSQAKKHQLCLLLGRIGLAMAPADILLLIHWYQTQRTLPYFRKSLVSVKMFWPAILGPAMAVPILWAPGIFWFFLQENLHAHKIPRCGGGGFGVFALLGGGGADWIFMGAGTFLSTENTHYHWAL